MLHTSPSRLQLRSEPDWLAAAQLLIDGCTHSPDARSRVELLERLCDALGPSLYPALLGVLCMVGRHGSVQARGAVADTLAEAMASGRLPSGRRAAWGCGAAWQADGPSRSLGPVEYLCATYAEPDAMLAATDFDLALEALLGLVSQSPKGRALYCEHLRLLADDPLDDGAFSRMTRDRLRQLAITWQRCGADLNAPGIAFRQVDAATSARSLRSLAGAHSLR